jgi:hypothetical protein
LSNVSAEVWYQPRELLHWNVEGTLRPVNEQQEAAVHSMRLRVEQCLFVCLFVCLFLPFTRKKSLERNLPNVRRYIIVGSKRTGD